MLNPYAGQPLSSNVSNAYTWALGQAGGLTDAGWGVLGDAGGYGSQAGDAFSSMAGYTPSDVTPGSLEGMDMSGYMNPYIQDVIDATMNDLNYQYGVQRQGIDDRATAQNAFGGDRWQLQQGVLGGDFLRTKASTLADLYRGGFDTAQNAARFDVGNRLTADTGNADRRAGIWGAGATGLGGLAQMYGGQGSDLLKYGIGQTSDLANMGFGFGNELQRNQLAAGALQRQQQQQLIDAIHAQYLGYTGAPQSSLAAYLGAILNPPTGSGTTSSNPGLLGWAQIGTGALGSLF